MNRILAFLAPLALSMALLTGCATLSAESDNLAAKTAVQFAALKVIDEKPGRADEVYRITDEVMAMLDGTEQTRLDVIEKRVRAEIDWSKLDAAEALVVARLIDVVRLEVEARIDEGELDPDEQVAVRRVVAWVQEAAQMAGGGA